MDEALVDRVKRALWLSGQWRTANRPSYEERSPETDAVLSSAARAVIPLIEAAAFERAAAKIDKMQRTSLAIADIAIEHDEDSNGICDIAVGLGQAARAIRSLTEKQG